MIKHSDVIEKGFIGDSLREVASFVRYNRAVRSKNGSILKKMKDTKSIFIHIPKTGGKSIFQSVYSTKLHEGLGHAGLEVYRTPGP